MARKTEKLNRLSMGVMPMSIYHSMGHEHVGMPVDEMNKSIKSLYDRGFHILGKEDVKKELSRTKELYGMDPDEFYKAWRNDEIHDVHATKLGCLYEFYRDEYE